MLIIVLMPEKNNVGIKINPDPAITKGMTLVVPFYSRE
jgi:hypothetical protein